MGKRRFIIFCILIFIFVLFIRISAINLKQDMFVDEMFTTQIANYSPYYSGISVPIEPNIHLTGYELKQKLLALEPTFEDTLSDIINLHKYTRDTPHSNLYYSLYRLWFNGWGEFKLKSFIVHGASLNLIFWTIGFIYLYKILKCLFKHNSTLITFGLFTAFLSTAAITNTIFIRSYALQEMFFLILTYTTIKYWYYLNDRRHIYKIFAVFKLGLVIALTFLTGYYSAFLIVLYALLLLYKTIKLKNWDALRFFIAACITSLYTVFLIYPGICYVLFSYRAKETYNNFLLLSNFKNFLLYSPIIILRYLFSIPVIAAVACYFNKIKKGKDKPAVSELFVPLYWLVLIWTILILFICPYKNIRYIMPIVPLLMLIFPYLAALLPKRKVFISIISGIFLLNIFIAMSEFIGFDFRKYIPLAAKIEFMKNPRADKFVFSKNPDIPVYIIQDGIQGPVYTYTGLNDTQIYYISNGTPKSIKFNHFYTIRNLRDTAYMPEDFPPNYELIESKYNCSDDYVCEEYLQRLTK